MAKPSTGPEQWATDTLFTNGPGAASEDTKVAPTSGQIAEGLVAGQSVKVQHLNWILNHFGEWLEWLENESKSGVYGTGTDGAWDTAVDGTTLPDRAVHFTDFTIRSGDTVTGRMHPIFCSGTLTIESTGLLQCSGSAGPGGAGGFGGIGGGTPTQGTFAAGGTGGGGGSSSVAGTGAGSTSAVGWAGSGGMGGQGNGTNAGGFGGAVSPPGADVGSYRHLEALINGVAIGRSGVTPICGGAGGGGGGGGQTGGGAGGGGGGGVIVVVARLAVIDGTIECRGGAGGAGEATNGGGGGGGGGGRIVLVTRSRTGSGVLQCPGGAGGAGDGTGLNGTVGDDGVVVELFA